MFGNFLGFKPCNSGSRMVYFTTHEEQERRFLFRFRELWVGATQRGCGRLLAWECPEESGGCARYSANEWPGFSSGKQSGTAKHTVSSLRNKDGAVFLLPLPTRR